MTTGTSAGRPTPSSTYRVQIGPGFGFDDATAIVTHLARLGVSHLYLSPVLQPAVGSTHGYDVVDHDRISQDAGGRPAFDRLAAAAADAGVGLVVDVVPNHMAIPTPQLLNVPLWSVLADGPDSPYASWFDIDWSVPGRTLLMPVLGRRIGEVLDAHELVLDPSGGPDASPVLRYHDHVFPVRAGTQQLPLPELLDQQWYRLAHWRVADDELNYRRFFNVTTLAAIRVERAEVFDATHRLLLRLVADGVVDGLRIDHPDGLADPRGYLARLAEATGGAWVVVEKILERHERLPPDWSCAGTTGYDALNRIGGLFVDPDGEQPLTELWHEFTDQTCLAEVVEAAKRETARGSLHAEVRRLVSVLGRIGRHDVRLRDHTERTLHETVVELLVALDRYRAYVVPGEPAPAESVAALEAAADRARRRLPAHRHTTLDMVVDLALGRASDPTDQTRPRTDATANDGTHDDQDARRRAEFIVRFQQTCGPVMAKGVEDTAFYRWLLLTSLTEVGGDPGQFSVSPEQLNDFLTGQQASWPDSMTTLSTHDTKRSEDVRARLATLSEYPREWAATVRDVRTLAAERLGTGDREGEGRTPRQNTSSRTAASGAGVDAATEYLVWQTLAGTWSPDGPISAERLRQYATKAVREAGTHTRWTAPDERYEAAVHRFVDGVATDEAILRRIASFIATTHQAWRAGVLGQKLVQLMAPGVPDVYQGTELVTLCLVDPDNRRPVDYAARQDRLAALDVGAGPRDLDDEKLLVTSRALRLRREQPSWFTGRSASYVPVATSTEHAVAFGRAGTAEHPAVIAVATRRVGALERGGGWQQHTIDLPDGQGWRDLLTGRTVTGGSGALATILEQLPVALLVRSVADPT
ncbi:MAG: malto-oligosyltrehalose synthase [Angustibacter sp.]